MNNNPVTRILFALVLCCSVCLRVHANLAADEMATAANKFLEALNADQKAKARFEFKGDERANWHYIPLIRKGLTIKEMNEEQRTLARALLASGLSQQGYNKATNIMSL